MYRFGNVFRIDGNPDELRFVIRQRGMDQYVSDLTGHSAICPAHLIGLSFENLLEMVIAENDIIKFETKRRGETKLTISGGYRGETVCVQKQNEVFAEFLLRAACEHAYLDQKNSADY